MALKFLPDDAEILYKHFTVKNFLLEASNNYDVIIGNPPWGSIFSSDDILKLQKSFLCCKDKPESYSLFIERAIQILNKDGLISFVVPEAILDVSAHKNIRRLILKETRLARITYLDNAFDNIQCPCIILNLEKNHTEYDEVPIAIQFKDKCFSISNTARISDSSLNFYANDIEYDILSTMENSQVEYLKNNATFALGIVTGDNKKHLISKEAISKNFLDYEPIYKGSDIGCFSKNEAANYIKFSPNRYQQIAPIDCYRAKEKLMYRFINNRPVFAYDNEQCLTLNSCNILIPKIPGMDIKYILGVLNSDLMAFYYRNKFHSVKMLKSHIEKLPIPKCSSRKQKEIISYVDILISSKKDSLEYREAFSLLNKKVAELYKLSGKQKKAIKI